MTVVPYDTISTTSQPESVFTKCCCCIPLRIGCFILGYLNLIFNSVHTLALFTLTTYIGLSTHWFDHFDLESPRTIKGQSTEIELIERPLLIHVEVMLMVVLCANVAWLIITVICLVGLHKKRPGPIKVYITFAMARLILMFSGLVYLVFTGSTSTQSVVSYSVDLGLAAYFISVYYIYAIQLEREQIKNNETQNATDITFVYPTKIQKC
ncbi:unnamed protein product, partial [Iphiclides podalirius]